MLGAPAIVYLGVISYGFYLYHWAVLKQILDWRIDGTLGPLSTWEWLGARPRRSHSSSARSAGTSWSVPRCR